jgi:hypothetical protein
MAKERPKTKKKIITIPIKTPKPKPTEVSSLTKAEEFYIDNNLNKPDTDLAKDLGKSLPVIRDHLHKTQVTSRISKLLIRDKGCVIMTEGASMAADEARKGYVSEQAIRDASNRGDYEEASRLQSILKSQRQETNDAAKTKSAEYIHFIKK